MTELAWNAIGDRTFDMGLDRGVLYLPDGTAVPWNGLVAVEEEQEREIESVNYDGVKIHDVVSFGSFSASLSAISYPKELEKLEGTGQITKGIYLGEQPTVRFGLCYRTRRGNDLEGEEAGYRIHVVYNVSAVPTGKAYSTITEEPVIVEHQWQLSAVPDYMDDFRPSSHLVIDTTTIDELLLVEIEQILYGNTDADASLMSMPDLVNYLKTWFRVYITDHGDGTWSATSNYEGYIFPNTPGSGQFTLQDVDATYISDVEYRITDSSLPLSGPPPDPDPDPESDIFADSYGDSY